MGLFKKWQAIWNPDGSLTFRQLEIDDQQFIERGPDKIVKRSWLHLWSNEYQCNGYRSLRPCMVTPAWPNHVVLELHPGIIDNNEKPDKGESGEAGFQNAEQWLGEIGLAAVVRIFARRSKIRSQDKVILYLGIVALLVTVLNGIALLLK